MHTNIRLSRVLAIGILALGTGVLSAQSPTISGCSVFPADNVWNAKVDTLPLAQYSSSYIQTISATKGVHADFGSGNWDGGPIGIPFVVVPGTQPKVPVKITWADESDPGPYPIPPDAPVEGGSQSTGDRHVIVLDQGQCILYELFAATKNADGSWKAASGSRFDLKSNALRPAGWTSGDAAGLPILPGLVRYDEVASGEIRHAIRFTAPQTAASYIWPARHKASSLTGTQYPPLGQRFRLKASFDISGFPAPVQVILKAMKTYGMILADNGSAWFVSGAPDPRWDNDQLSLFSKVKGSDFEAIDESSLRVNPDSGQVSTKIALGVTIAQPVMLGGASTTTNTVMLNAPAPYGGAVISINSSNSAAASVPASVTIPANAQSATFPITTSPVSTSTPVTITAYYLGTPTSSTLRVDPGAFSGVTLSSSAVTGPATVVATVTLTGPVLGGASIGLTSSNPTAATVPTSVLIGSGLLTATFPITVKSVSQVSSATITASMGSVSRTATLTINPTAVSSPALPSVPGVLTFQQGTNGYNGGSSATITNMYTSFAWNGGVGTTYRESSEHLSRTGLKTGVLIRFDQLSIPAGKSVVSATLTVTVNNWTAGSVATLQYLKTAWDINYASLGWSSASAATKWAVAGATGAGSDLLAGSATAPLKGNGDQVVTIPLDPALVAVWLANPAANQGFRLEASGNGNTSLYSTRYSTVSKRPVLTISVQ